MRPATTVGRYMKGYMQMADVYNAHTYVYNAQSFLRVAILLVDGVIDQTSHESDTVDIRIAKANLMRVDDILSKLAQSISTSDRQN